MKNVFTYMTALLLVVWYSLSVIGFDVHTCSTSGDTYIATVISGTECEDIHPEHTRKCCSCCHHDDVPNDTHDAEESVKSGSCCTDQWQMIDLTGLKTSDEKMDLSDYIYDSYVCGPQQYSDDYSLKILAHGRALYKPDPGTLKCLDFQQIYSIWRI